MTEQVLYIEGIPVKLTRKRMKSVRLRVKSPSGDVCLSAPYHVPEAELRTFVAARADWIRQQQTRIAASPSARAEAASREEIEAWRTVVKACVPPLIEQWAAILDVHPKTIAYRNMKSRWGSCQPETGRICFNIRLALYPPECLEYVRSRALPLPRAEPWTRVPCAHGSRHARLARSQEEASMKRCAVSSRADSTFRYRFHVLLQQRRRLPYHENQLQECPAR